MAIEALPPGVVMTMDFHPRVMVGHNRPSDVVLFTKIVADVPPTVTVVWPVTKPLPVMVT